MSISSILRSRRTLLGAGIAAVALVPAGLAVASARTTDEAVSARTTATVLADTTLASAGADVTLTDEQIEALLFMRQEEKLAGDVYDVLYELWGLQVFTNIANNGERTHEAETAATMALFGIDDPIAELGPGEFLDPGLQALYDDLVARGSVSEVEALLVGALIEEVDIADLRERETGIDEIDATFDLLEAGSHKHLQAFVRNLDRYGVDYEAQVLDQADVDAILDGSNTLAQDVLGDHDHGGGGSGTTSHAGGQGNGQGAGRSNGHGGGNHG